MKDGLKRWGFRKVPGGRGAVGRIKRLLVYHCTVGGSNVVVKQLWYR